jgi:hypothetical protein
VIETIVLLKEAKTFTKPVVTFLEPLALRTLIAPKLLLEEFLGGGLLGDAAHQFNGLCGGARERPALSSVQGRRSAAGFAALGPSQASCRQGQQRCAPSGGGFDGFLFLGS